MSAGLQQCSNYLAWFPMPVELHHHDHECWPHIACERCGEIVADEMAYEVDGDFDCRRYCSEKCMYKPGEAGDPS